MEALRGDKTECERPHGSSTSHNDRPAQQHGLMHLSSAAEALVSRGMARAQISTTIHAPSNRDTSESIPSQLSAEPEQEVLPAGWQRIMHDSGLPCYVHETDQLVSWTRPYSLDSMDYEGGFLALARCHVPPLSIFRRKQVTKSRSASPATSSTQAPAIEQKEHLSRKRKLSEDNAGVHLAAPLIKARRRVATEVPVVEVNGVAVQSAEGRTVHAFLRDIVTTAWRAVPQYNFNKHDDLQQPVSCSIRILEKTYPAMFGLSKPLAKDAAAEAVLDELLPGFWAELKQEGRVGKPSQLLQQLKPADKKTSSEQHPSVSLEEFKTLPIKDPRILQACMELAIKTPAQVLQEYQNRNRGISVNYNTIPVDKDGVKLFKTITTAGSTAAEGVASTKKVAKQLAAQSLLAILHERTVSTYAEMAELYSSVGKAAQPINTESSQPNPMKTDSYGGVLKKARRTSPARGQGYGMPPSHFPPTYSRSGGTILEWEGYTGYGSASAAEPANGWTTRQYENGTTGYGGNNNNGSNNKKERIVEYSAAPAPVPAPASAPPYPGYYGGSSSWVYGPSTDVPAYPNAGFGGYPPGSTTNARPYQSSNADGRYGQGYSSTDARAGPYHRPKSYARPRYPPM